MHTRSHTERMVPPFTSRARTHAHILNSPTPKRVRRLNQRIVKLLLRKLGFNNVSVADNGLIATEMCEHHRFDVVLMDLHVCLFPSTRARLLVLWRLGPPFSSVHLRDTRDSSQHTLTFVFAEAPPPFS